MIGIFIAVLLVGILFPVSFNQIFNANQTGWDANTKTTFKLIPIISVVAIIVALTVLALARTGRI